MKARRTGLGLCALALAASLGCTSPNRTTATLQKAGFRDIEVGGYGWVSCSDSDDFSTKFKAKNSNGQTVEGVVCCGLLKSCTIRY